MAGRPFADGSTYMQDKKGLALCNDARRRQGYLLAPMRVERQGTAS